MPIITVNQNPANQLAMTISRRTDRLYEHIIGEVQRLAELVWVNGNVTPQELFAELGTEGYKLFALSSAAIQLANQAKPEDQVTLSIPYEYIINQDGSVTVGNRVSDPE